MRSFKDYVTVRSAKREVGKDKFYEMKESFLDWFTKSHNVGSSNFEQVEGMLDSLAYLKARMSQSKFLQFLSGALMSTSVWRCGDMPTGDFWYLLGMGAVIGVTSTCSFKHFRKQYNNQKDEFVDLVKYTSNAYSDKQLMVLKDDLVWSNEGTFDHVSDVCVKDVCDDMAKERCHGW